MKRQVTFRLEENLYDEIRIMIIRDKKYPSFQNYLESLILKDLEAKENESNENNGNI